MSISQYGSIKFTGSNPTKLPDGDGDLFYEQDRSRDFAWLWERAGALAADIMGTPALVSGGVVTGPSFTTLNITPAVGYAPFTVSLGNSNTVPPATADETLIAVRVASAQLTGVTLTGGSQQGGTFLGNATLNGTTNYVKLKYAEVDSLSRQRAKAAGTWYFTKAPSSVITVDTSAPGSAEVLLATLVGDGSTYLTITTRGVTAPGVQQFQTVSGYTPAAGDVVELWVDGSIRKAKRGNFSLALGGGVSTGGICRVGAIDATHGVALYAAGATLAAVMVTLSPVDLAISLETPVTVVGSAAATFDVSIIDSIHVLVAYVVGTQLSVVVLTANTVAHTLSVNTPVNGSATASYLGLSQVPGTTNICMTWFNSATTIQGAVVSVSGTTPTINAAATSTVTAWGAFGQCENSVNAAGTQAIVGYVLAASPYQLHYTRFTISGTSTAFADDIDTTLSNSGQFLGGGATEEAAGGFFGIAMQMTAGSTPALDFGLVEYGPTASYPIIPKLFSLGRYPSNINHVLIRAVDKPGGIVAMMFPYAPYIDPLNVSVMFFRRLKVHQYTFGDVYTAGANASANGAGGICVLPQSEIALCVQGLGAANQSPLLACRRRNKVIGLAVDATGRVQTSGTFITSGLTPGSKYYSDDNGALTTTQTEVQIGYARSTTELVLNVMPGL